MTRTIPEALPESLRSEVETLYRELEAEVSSLGVGCWVRGDCCDFDRYDHRLYASTLEVAYALDARRPDPAQESDAESRLCPFWKERRCTAREGRPLGCRTFFCDRRFRGPLGALYEKYLRRLHELAAAHSFEWSYEPFVDAVRQHARLRRPPGEAP